MNKNIDKSPKVLLIEDDTFIANAYIQGLVNEGIEVGIAHNGDEAMEMLSSERPGLILLDIVMAGKDGFAVLEEVKGREDLKDIPVIILSNLGETSDIEKGTGLGAIDYIIKSDHSLSEVVEKVKSVLQ